jgi:hypothetical protein
MNGGIARWRHGRIAAVVLALAAVTPAAQSPAPPTPLQRLEAPGRTIVISEPTTSVTDTEGTEGTGSRRATK